MSGRWWWEPKTSAGWAAWYLGSMMLLVCLSLALEMAVNLSALGNWTIGFLTAVGGLHVAGRMIDV